MARLTRRALGVSLLAPSLAALCGCRCGGGSHNSRATGTTEAAHDELSIEIDARSSTGPFARLSGVQGSPVPIVAGEPDLTLGFARLHIERARIDQDCEPNTLTLAGIFPDETADPDAPASYDFAAIDRHVAAARAAGAEILWQASYDVGRSDRWVGLNLGGRAPEDLARWGRVVSRCLEHFNNGWANGMSRAVSHVEFVNEPDGLGGFGGPHARRLLPAFAEFLAVVARYDAAHPDTPVRAVGPGIPLSLAEWPTWQPRFAKALEHLRAARLALPVFSFHTYGADVSPRSNGELARALRALLDQHGMAATELWNSEWLAGEFLRAHLRVDPQRLGTVSAHDAQRFASAMAAYAIACKLRWQGLVSGSIYYRANRRAFPEGRTPPQHGLGAGAFFAPDGTPQRLGLHERLLGLAQAAAPERCTTRYPDDGLVTALGLRTPDARTLGAVVANLHAEPRRLALRFTGAASASSWTARALGLDAEHEELWASPLAATAAEDAGLRLRHEIGALSSVLVLLERR